MAYCAPNPLGRGDMPDLDVSLMRGTLDLLILKALSWGPRHGYAIAEWIEMATGTALLIGEGTLYPALHRLERQALVEAEWGLSENNRNAKYYRLSAAGRRRLQTGSTSWHQFVEAAGRALRATTPAPA
jgi:transcriptional regulator